MNHKKALYRSIRQKGKKVKQHQLDGKIPLYKQKLPLIKAVNIKEIAAFSSVADSVTSGLVTSDRERRILEASYG
jgi:hypothetical protein